MRAAAAGAAGGSLAVLVAVNVFNHIDRQIMVILLEPVKRALGASDFQMGLLTGPAFAIFYTFAGIPIGRLADRSVRRNIIALSLAAWSATTALCGAVQTTASCCWRASASAWARPAARPRRTR